MLVGGLQDRVSCPPPSFTNLDHLLTASSGGLRLVIEHTVTCVFALQAHDLQMAGRGRAAVALARQTAMYLAHTAFGLSMSDVGTLFERDRTTVSHACALIEDRREDACFDRVLELLERAVVALCLPRAGRSDPFPPTLRLPMAPTPTPPPQQPTACAQSTGRAMTVEALLERMARRGVRGELVLLADGARALQLVIRGSSTLPDTVPFVVFSAARDAGYLIDTDGQGHIWTLAALGRAVLRQHRSASDHTTTPGSSNPPVAAAHEASSAQHTSQARPGRDPTESPLGWLRRRKDKHGDPLISAVQFEAGERLRSDMTFASMGPRVTVNWGAGGGGGGSPSGLGVEISDRVSDAQQRVRRALAAVGPLSGGLLIDVCAHLKGLEEVERSRGWPARSGKVGLQLALSELARHYGMSEPERGSRKPRLRHWALDGYRPASEPQSG